ncbi:unnamed protein product [Effrenium voratum]|nr:unnamed protein product [Effrenium voratum]
MQWSKALPIHFRLSEARALRPWGLGATGVVVQSIMNGAIGLVVYQYMDSMAAGNLDYTLDSVGDTTATCLSSWLRRNELTSWTQAETWKRWFRYQEDADEYVIQHTCSPFPTSAMNQSCATMRVPVYEFESKLGYPLGLGEKPSFNNDILYAFAYTFLGLGLLNLIGFAVHDLTLLSRRNQNYILDWPAFNTGFPLFRKFTMLAGLPILQKLFTMEGTGRGLAIAIGVILTPVIILWAVLFLVFVITPFMLILFVRYPVRLSRFAVFLTLIATAVFGLCMAIIPLVYLTVLGQRPRYALVYRVSDFHGEGECFCGCSYFINAASLVRIFAIGAGVVFTSCLSAFRCLKGLRRAQWANLMFPLPVTVYSVFWTTPAGDPIQHRKEGEPVQSEMAFDPFALMDEQPESRYMTVTLKPEFAYDVDALGRWKPLGDRVMDGPTLPELKKGEFFKQPTEVLGCCGFPCLTGGYQVIYISDSEDESPVNKHDTQYPDVMGCRTGSSSGAGAPVGGQPTAAKTVKPLPTMKGLPTMAPMATRARSRTESAQSSDDKRMQRLNAALAGLTLHVQHENTSRTTSPLPSPLSTPAIPMSQVRPPVVLGNPDDLGEPVSDRAAATPRSGKFSL